MTKNIEAQVLIVGGGPVGLTLATDLAWRGVGVVVAETRQRGEPPSVKCNHVSARTDGNLPPAGRRQGSCATSGLPADYRQRRVVPHDLHRRGAVAHPHPFARDRYTDKSGPDGWWPTAEPPHRINQIYLEPVLFAHAEATPGRHDPLPHPDRRIHAGRGWRERQGRRISTAAKKSGSSATT